MTVLYQFCITIFLLSMTREWICELIMVYINLFKAMSVYMYMSM